MRGAHDAVRPFCDILKFGNPTQTRLGGQSDPGFIRQSFPGKVSGQTKPAVLTCISFLLSTVLG